MVPRQCLWCILIFSRPEICSPSQLLYESQFESFYFLILILVSIKFQVLHSRYCYWLVVRRSMPSLTGLLIALSIIGSSFGSRLEHFYHSQLMTFIAILPTGLLSWHIECNGRVQKSIGASQKRSRGSVVLPPGLYPFPHTIISSEH